METNRRAAFRKAEKGVALCVEAAMQLKQESTGNGLKLSVSSRQSPPTTNRRSKNVTSQSNDAPVPNSSKQKPTQRQSKLMGASESPSNNQNENRRRFRSNSTHNRTDVSESRQTILDEPEIIHHTEIHRRTRSNDPENRDKMESTVSMASSSAQKSERTARQLKRSTDVEERDASYHDASKRTPIEHRNQIVQPEVNNIDENQRQASLKSAEHCNAIAFATSSSSIHSESPSPYEPSESGVQYIATGLPTQRVEYDENTELEIVEDSEEEVDYTPKRNHFPGLSGGFLNSYQQ